MSPSANRQDRFSTARPQDGRRPLSEHRLAVLCHTALEGIFVVDDERRYVRLNEPAEKLLGAPVEKILGRRIEDFTPRELRPRLDRIWAELERAGTLSGSLEILRGDGAPALIEFQAAWEFGPGRHLLAARKISRFGPDERRQGATAPDQVPQLTRREREVLQLAAEGASTSEIAAALVVSAGTVKIHFQHIYEKLGVGGRVSAVAAGLRNGVIR